MKADYLELDFCRWLDERYCEDVTQGDTTRETRKQRVRELVQRCGEANLPLKHRTTGESRTIAQVFESIYGEPLLVSA